MSKNFYFDIETGGKQASESSILSVSYGAGTDKIKSLYARPEDGTRLFHWARDNVWEEIKHQNLSTERELLENFLGVVEKNEGSTFTGWNIGVRRGQGVGQGAPRGFDIPFLFSRAEKHGLLERYQEAFGKVKIRDLGAEYSYNVAKEVIKYPELVDPDLFAQAKSYAKMGMQWEKNYGMSSQEAAHAVSQGGYMFRGWKQEEAYEFLLGGKYKAHVSEFDTGALRELAETNLSPKGPEFVKTWNERVLAKKLGQVVEKEEYDIVGQIAKRAAKRGRWMLPAGVAVGIAGLYATKPLSLFSGKKDGYGDNIGHLSEADQKEAEERFSFFSGAIEKYGKEVGTGHKRVLIPEKALGQQELESLGFVPTEIAIPESGQSDITSWRHPDKPYHLHEHSDAWTMHKDAHAASTMLVYKWKQEQRVKAAKERDDSIFTPISLFLSGAPHVVEEGLPGAFYYLRGLLSDTKSMRERLEEELSPEYMEMANRFEPLRIPGRDDAYNTIEGLPHGGMAEKKRRELTDFGSGYQGDKSEEGIGFGTILKGINYGAFAGLGALTGYDRFGKLGAIVGAGIAIGLIGGTEALTIENPGNDLGKKMWNLGVQGVLTSGSSSMMASSTMRGSLFGKAITKAVGKDMLEGLYLDLHKAAGTPLELLRAGGAGSAGSVAMGEYAASVFPKAMRPAVSKMIQASSGSPYILESVLKHGEIGNIPAKEYALGTIKDLSAGATVGFVPGAALAFIGHAFSGKDDEYNTIEGLPHGGMAEQKRRELTEFGSGYRGIVKVPGSLDSIFGRVSAFTGGTDDIIKAFSKFSKKNTRKIFLRKVKNRVLFSKDDGLVRALTYQNKETQSFLADLKSARKAGHKHIIGVQQSMLDAVKERRMPLKELKSVIRHEQVHIGARARLGEGFVLGEAPKSWDEFLKAQGYNAGRANTYFEEFVAYSTQGKYLRNDPNPFRTMLGDEQFGELASLMPDGIVEPARKAAKLGEQLRREGQSARLAVIAKYKGTRIPGQDDAYNTIEGLRHGGMSEVLRKELTDFGSGWIRKALSKAFKSTQNSSLAKTAVSNRSLEQQIANLGPAFPEAGQGNLLKTAIKNKTYVPSPKRQGWSLSAQQVREMSYDDFWWVVESRGRVDPTQIIKQRSSSEASFIIGADEMKRMNGSEWGDFLSKNQVIKKSSSIKSSAPISESSSWVLSKDQMNNMGKDEWNSFLKSKRLTKEKLEVVGEFKSAASGDKAGGGFVGPGPQQGKTRVGKLKAKLEKSNNKAMMDLRYAAAGPGKRHISRG